MVAISLTYFQPTAEKVFVAGSFNDWQADVTPLRRKDDGHWSVDLMLKPGRYEYRFVVDGEWRDDPLATRYVANPFGGLNSVLEVTV